MSLIHHFQDVNVCVEDLAKDTTRQRDAEIARFEAYYAAGGKLWTRELLASVADQIDAANEAFRKHGGELTEEQAVVVRVPNVEGGDVFDFTIRLGVGVRGKHGENGEYFVRKIMAGYNAWRQFRSPGPDNKETTAPAAPLAWHSITIAHVLGVRDKTTREPYGIQLFGPPDGSARRFPIPSPQEVTERLSKAVGHWKKSDGSPLLPTRIPAVLAQKSTPRIAKIIGFGLGSMADPYSQELPHRPYGQHSLLIALADMVEAAQGQRPILLAQDPGYVPADEAALSTQGVRVVEDPRGLVEIDEETLVLDIACNAPVEQVVADICRPAAIMTADLMQPPLNGSSPRVKRMVESEYETTELYERDLKGGEDDRFNELLWLMQIYTRKGGERE